MTKHVLFACYYCIACSPVTYQLLSFHLFSVHVAASDILLRQSCAKILVGDPHQQIYAFRGARNALQEVQGTHMFYLTLVSSSQLWIYCAFQ